MTWLKKGETEREREKLQTLIHIIQSTQRANSRHTADGCRSPLRTLCEGHVGFPVEEIVRQGGEGNCGSELMQMGGAGGSRGITSKAPRCRGADVMGACRPHEELRGMLTIAIASTNPGVSRPAPPQRGNGI